MKQRLFLNFPKEACNKPITYELIKNYNVQVNIINASITQDEEGYLLIEMIADEDKIKKTREYITSSGVICMPVEKRVKLDYDKCVHCGACTAVCFPAALTMSPEDGKLVFTPEKCVACGLCITACPLKLFSINYGE